MQGDIPVEIVEMGFTIADSIKLLGFTISNEDDILECNFQPVKRKIENIIRFWERFYLSLAGKITVYKTLLLPQLNYIGTILMPSENMLAELSDTMEKFVTTGFQIAKKRLYTPTSEGGIGLFNLKTFLIALQSTMVKRAFDCCNDSWKFDIVCGSEHCFSNVGENQTNLGKTLCGITKSFRTFAEDFAKVANNYLHIPILNSPLFNYSNTEGDIFDRAFFGENCEIAILKKLTWDKLTENNTFCTLTEARQKIVIDITPEMYGKLKIGWNRANKKFFKEGEKSNTLLSFMTVEKKGSKRFRAILTKNQRLEAEKTLAK